VGSSARSKARSNARSSAGVTDRVATGVRDRVAPTDTDLAIARSRVEETRRRISEGESVSGISQTYHVPVRAVELSLAAPEAPAVPPASGGVEAEVRQRVAEQLAALGAGAGASASTWAMSGHSPEPVESVPTIYQSLDDTLKSLKIDAGPRGYVLRRFSRYEPNDYQSLLEILSSLSLPVGVARAAVDDYRELTEGPRRKRHDSREEDEDVLSRLRRRQMQSMEMRLFEAEVRAAEREARGPTAPTDRASDTPTEQIRDLERRLAAKDRELLEASHRTELAAIEARFDQKLAALSSKRSLADVQLSATEGKAQLQLDSASRAIGMLADEVKSRPRTIHKLAEGISPELARTGAQFVRQQLAVLPENQGELIEPSPEHLREVAAELEGIASDGQSAAAERRPSRLVPGSWLPKASDEPAT
jgi:hypothetical protein